MIFNNPLPALVHRKLSMENQEDVEGKKVTVSRLYLHNHTYILNVIIVVESMDVLYSRTVGFPLNKLVTFK